MAFLTLHEMLPLAFDYAGQKKAVKAVFLGMAFMSARYYPHCFIFYSIYLSYTYFSMILLMLMINVTYGTRKLCLASLC